MRLESSFLRSAHFNQANSRFTTPDAQRTTGGILFSAAPDPSSFGHPTASSLKPLLFGMAGFCTGPPLLIWKGPLLNNRDVFAKQLAKFLMRWSKILYTLRFDILALLMPPSCCLGTSCMNRMGTGGAVGKTPGWQGAQSCSAGIFINYLARKGYVIKYHIIDINFINWYLAKKSLILWCTQQIKTLFQCFHVLFTSFPVLALSFPSAGQGWGAGSHHARKTGHDGRPLQHGQQISYPETHRPAHQ